MFIVARVGACIALGALLMTPPAEAQFGGLLGKKKSAETTEKKACTPTSEAKKKRNKIFGAVLGGVADNVVGRTGVTSVVGGYLPVGSLLSDAIIAQLNCDEQQQAAKATEDALRGETVGAESNWTSGSRKNVSGKSKVTGKQKLADGSTCATVTDVIIVEGEETTVPKRMCRKPGASGYVLSA